MPAAAQKVRWIDASSMEFRALFSRTPPISGPNTRARLAPDCSIPSVLPCSRTSADFDARLVNAGDASEFPNASRCHPDQQSRQPARDWPDERDRK